MADFSSDARQLPRRTVRFDPTRERGAVYDDAARHSRLVRWLKIGLPALAIIGVLGFFATMRIIPSDLAGLISRAGIDTKTNSLVMDKPHISGFEGTRQSYDVKAERAIQSLADPKVVTFEEISAEFGLEEQGTATVSADTGTFDGNADTLQFDKGFAAKTTKGYQALFEGADIDLRNGSLKSTRPIEIRSSDATIRANEVEISDRGKKIVFRNGVSVTYTRPAIGDVAAEAPTEAE